MEIIEDSVNAEMRRDIESNLSELETKLIWKKIEEFDER